MKVLLLFPPKYGFLEGIKLALSYKSTECCCLDYSTSLSSMEKQINTQMFRFPYKVRQRWEQYFFIKINNWYIHQFERMKPDLVFVYNNQMLLSETLIWLRKRKVKIAFFLGDNPLYTHTSPYNLAILEHADSIFVPDSFWLIQLKKTGLQNVEFLLPPMPVNLYHPFESLDQTESKQMETEVLYVGMNYNNSWGYKKSKFLSYFTSHDLKIYGNRAWKRWFVFFPELESHFIEKSGFIPMVQLNKMYNCTKIVPVDGNPGIMNGIHARIIESLAAGTMPLMEWNADINEIFRGITDLPAVQDYREIPERLSYYLNDEDNRQKLVQKMRSIYNEKYNNKSVSDLIFNSLSF